MIHLNSIIIEGNKTGEISTKEENGTVSLLKFDICSIRGEEQSVFTVELSGRTADSMAQFIGKYNSMTVIGRLHQEKDTGKVKILAENIDFRQ